MAPLRICSESSHFSYISKQARIHGYINCATLYLLVVLDEGRRYEVTDLTVQAHIHTFGSPGAHVTTFFNI